MSSPSRFALVGNSLPRRCGIATFTTDLQRALEQLPACAQCSIVAMNDAGRSYDYPAAVRLQIDDRSLPDYASAANALNRSGCDVVSLQHEFGIFGGEAGSHILALTSRLTVPLVTTFHTVIERPSPAQRRVVGEIVAACARVVTMAEKGRDLLRTVYQVESDKIEVIAHGTPDGPFIEPDEAKHALGFAGRQVILTFGLLSPSKGIEIMINAMPEILKSNTTAVYVVLGATHPNLVREQGETYRNGLMARVRALGIDEHVVFLERFVDQATLLRFISMCDVYATPYLNAAQMTSGTLAYSFGLGKAVISTPYWHARELLADGRGVLVPFGDVGALGRETAALLSDAPRRLAMRQRAYASGRPMIWPRIAERYRALFEQVSGDNPRHDAAHRNPGNGAVRRVAQAVSASPLTHFVALCDDTGLLQHAVHGVADRAHGYCTDDNARALLLAGALDRAGEASLPEVLTNRFAAFLQHAWNPECRRFHNFMSFDRRWLDEAGSEDSHGRALWALGECARSDHDPARRRWAAALFAAALPVTELFQSPRAWSFVLLGLDGYCSVFTEHSGARHIRERLANQLLESLAAAETPDWEWFEDGLAYDNARLPQALLVTGRSSGARREYADSGLRSLRWLMRLQTTPAGRFRPFGSKSFGAKRSHPLTFDQQPVEAAASIGACIAAWHTDGADAWRVDAERSFAWFFGDNDLAVPLVDLDTGSCRDGLHPDRANENRGGESAVSYLLSLTDMRQFHRCMTAPPIHHARPRAGREDHA